MMVLIHITINSFTVLKGKDNHDDDDEDDGDDALVIK